LHIPQMAMRVLVLVARDLGGRFTDPQEDRRAVLLKLAAHGVPTEMITILRPHVAPFVQAVIAGEIDPMVTQPWELVREPALDTNTGAKTTLDLDPTEDPATRALIEQLIAQTGLYATSGALAELLGFVARLRSIAPFNAMLLHIQKPGLTYAATATHWWREFRRTPKPHARPLLMLRAMGPVDFVFDVLDTEGEPLPEAAFAFPVFGEMTEQILMAHLELVKAKGIEIEWWDRGDASAGQISLAGFIATKRGNVRRYAIALNRNHNPGQVFVTLCHELAHLYLGHLGGDVRLGIVASTASHAVAEVEAETVAYIVARRNGLTPRSESYLDNYKGSIAEMNLYAVMRAANTIETLLGRPSKLFQPRGTQASR
jgi:hypothetical protein